MPDPVTTPGQEKPSAPAAVPRVVLPPLHADTAAAQFEGSLRGLSEFAKDSISALRRNGVTVELRGWDLVRGGDGGFSATSLGRLSSAAQTAREIPRELRADLCRVAVCPFEINVTTSGSQATVYVYDLLAKTKLVGQYTCDQSDPAARREVLTQATALMAERAKAATENLLSPVAQDPSPKYGIRFDSNRKPSAQQVAVLKQYFDRYDFIRINSVGKNDIAETACLNRESFEKQGYASIAVEGRVMRISFEKSDEERGGMLRGQGSSAPHNDPTVDSDGNLLHRRPGLSSFHAFIRTDLSGERGGEQRSVRVSAPHTGLPAFEGIVYDRNPRLLGSANGVTILATADFTDLRTDTAEKLRSIESAAKRQAAYLGHPGLVKHILVIHSDDANASVNKGNRDTIDVNSRTLSEPHIDVAITAAHETSHLVDSVNSWRLSGGELPKLLQSRPSMPVFASSNRDEMFVDEKSFFGRVNGGHAAANARELFASTVNSLGHPNWERKVLELPLDQRAFYLRCLETIRDNMRQTETFPKRAPVVADLGSKISLLRRLIPETSRQQPRLPPYEQNNDFLYLLKLPQR